MRLAAALLLACAIKAQAPPENPAPKEPEKAEEPGPVVLHNTGKPITVPFTCTEDDMQWAGMSCSEEQPCPVYLEVSSMETVGNRIVLLGNLHSESTTLYSMLLTSEDGGATWQEPYERMRGVALDHMQLVDFQNGWISGETTVPVARDPFFLITSDGGKSWRLRPVLAEGGGGAIQQFHFESAANGAMVIDRMESGDSARYELFETPNGGETWMIRRTSEQPITLPRADPDAGSFGWRVRADARLKSFVIERRHGEKWMAVASFLVEIGTCRPVPHVVPPPEPPAEAAPAPEKAPSLTKPGAKP